MAYELELEVGTFERSSVDYKVDATIISQKRLSNGKELRLYRIDKNDVNIEKDWIIDDYNNNHFEKGKYSIVFRRKWNNLYGSYENILEPVRVEFLEYKRADVSADYREIETFTWNKNRVYYSYTKFCQDGWNEYEEVVIKLREHEARKKIFEIIKDWTYIIS